MRTEVIKCLEARKAFFKTKKTPENHKISTRYVLETHMDWLLSVLMEFGDWLCRMPQGIRSLSYLHIKLPHATKEGIRLHPFGLFVAVVCVNSLQTMTNVRMEISAAATLQPFDTRSTSNRWKSSFVLFCSQDHMLSKTFSNGSTLSSRSCSKVRFRPFS